MHVKVYDPFLTHEKAKEIGVEKIEIDELFKISDFISLHVPLTNSTKEIINAKSITKMKRGVKIINCARGGLVNETDLVNAINKGQVSGAAFDVFVEEPAHKNVLFGMLSIFLGLTGGIVIFLGIKYQKYTMILVCGGLGMMTASLFLIYEIIDKPLFG